jgi:type IV fimbrial biogenesis protein FimT
MLMRPGRERGITLVEILMTLALIGVLLAFAAPSATTWIQNTQLRSAADSIFTGVQLARNEALKRNSAVALEFTDAASTAWHVCMYDIANNVCTGSDLASKPAAEAGGNARAGADVATGDPSTALAAGNNLPGLVAFDALGRVLTSAPANLTRIDVRNPTLTSGERRLVILITPGGSVRMCDPQLALSANPMGCV